MTIGQEIKVVTLGVDKYTTTRHNSNNSYKLKKDIHVGVVIFNSRYIFTIKSNRGYNISFKKVDAKIKEIVVKGRKSND